LRCTGARRRTVEHGATMTSRQMVSWLAETGVHTFAGDLAPLIILSPSAPKKDFKFVVRHTLGPWTPSFWTSAWSTDSKRAVRLSGAACGNSATRMSSLRRRTWGIKRRYGSQRDSLFRIYLHRPQAQQNVLRIYDRVEHELFHRHRTTGLCRRSTRRTCAPRLPVLTSGLLDKTRRRRGALRGPGQW
jgi:hypothetical protein